MKRSQLQKNILSYVLLLLGLFIVAIPLWYMVSTAFKPQTMIFELPPQIWPNPSTLNNFIKALTTDNFGLYFWNSTKVAVTATLLTVAVSSMLAFAFVLFTSAWHDGSAGYAYHPAIRDQPLAEALQQSVGLDPCLCHHEHFNADLPVTGRF